MPDIQADWDTIWSILTLIFIFSVVFETALTPIFNWRIFAKYCEGKGVKTPITIFAAVTLLWNYDVDIFKQIVGAFDTTNENNQNESSSSVVGRVMTGLIIAGGSGAVFNIFTKFGFRNPEKLLEKARQAREQAEEAKQEG